MLQLIPWNFDGTPREPSAGWLSFASTGSKRSLFAFVPASTHHHCHCHCHCHAPPPSTLHSLVVSYSIAGHRHKSYPDEPSGYCAGCGRSWTPVDLFWQWFQRPSTIRATAASSITPSVQNCVTRVCFLVVDCVRSKLLSSPKRAQVYSVLPVRPQSLTGLAWPAGCGCWVRCHAMPCHAMGVYHTNHTRPHRTRLVVRPRRHLPLDCPWLCRSSRCHRSVPAL